MTIRGNIPVPLVTIGTSDTVVCQIPTDVERYAVSAFSLFNNSSSPVSVNIFLSPNTTSASGKKVFQYSIPANSDIDVFSVIGQGMGGSSAATRLNVIATASTGAVVNATLSITTYNGGD